MKQADFKSDSAMDCFHLRIVFILDTKKHFLKKTVCTLFFKYLRKGYLNVFLSATYLTCIEYKQGVTILETLITYPEPGNQSILERASNHSHWLFLKRRVLLLNTLRECNTFLTKL